MGVIYTLNCSPTARCSQTLANSADHRMSASGTKRKSSWDSETAATAPKLPFEGRQIKAEIDT